jgi:hypothetical protein
MRTAFRTPCISAFTLLEMMISAALMSLVLGTSYACLQAGLDTRKLIEPRSDTFQTARVALALIAADLRAACPLHKGPEFLGMKRQIGNMDADNLDFATHQYTPNQPNEGDYCAISWFVEREPKTGETRLWRRRNPTFAFDPLAGGTREEIASGVRGLKLEYYDGYDWYDTWGDVNGQAKKESSARERSNLSGLPEAARVTLLLASEPGKAKQSSETESRSETEAPSLRFQVVVRLNLAGTASSSGQSSTPTGNSSPTESRARPSN